MFIFPRNIGYVTAYAESSTQRQKVRCYSTREKNSHALAYAAHKLSTAFDQDKCATGVRTLQAHTESNRRAMTFLSSKFLPALLLMPVLFALCGAAQEPEDRKPQKPESMGVATGNPHAPVKDALSRPITAGGFVEEAAGRDISGDEAGNCFSCHGAAAVVNTKLQLDRLIPGVTCESCHGPGGSHATVMLFGPGKSMYIFNPKTLDAESLSQEFCGACHRGVDTVAMMPDLGGINNVRFQPYRLFNSRGHDPKDARFACTVCHDPHEDLKQEDTAYDAKCTTCHAPHGAEQATGEKNIAITGRRAAVSSVGKSCPVASERCVSCHMSKVELPGAHFKFTDHRIRIARQGEAYPY